MSDDVRLGLIIGGAVLVLAALLWRSVHHRRQTQAILRRLEDPDPQERARAGLTLVDLGLSRAARPVFAHVASEPDARVRLAIALAVGRRQWEPSNTKRVRQVREWAALELERQGEPMTAFGPAVTRLADMGGPRPPEEQPTGAGAAPGPASGVDAPDPLPGSAPEPAPESAPESTPDPIELIEWTPQEASTS